MGIIPTFEEYSEKQQITILIFLVVSVVFLLGVVTGIVLSIVYYQNMIWDKMYSSLLETESHLYNTRLPTNTIYPSLINQND